MTEPSGTVITNAYNAANQLCWTYVGTSTNARDHPVVRSASGRRRELHV